jgi:predicted metal-dependent hydrolase
MCQSGKDELNDGSAGRVDDKWTFGARRLRKWAERIGVEAKEIHVYNMTRKWASCSSRGRLTFDIDLLREPVAFRSEVIVHELVHLKVPNHGKLFRSLVRSYLGREPS